MTRYTLFKTINNFSFSRDEHTMVDARKEFYARAEEALGSDSDTEVALRWGKFTGKNLPTEQN